MFYDDVFHDIIESSPFSSTGKVILYNEEYIIVGIFCSGSYGLKDYDKGYSTRKSEKRQSFKISKQSIPAGLEINDLLRQTIEIDGKTWVISDITGNDSGVYELGLKVGA